MDNTKLLNELKLLEDYYEHLDKPCAEQMIEESTSYIYHTIDNSTFKEILELWEYSESTEFDLSKRHDVVNLRGYLLDAIQRKYKEVFKSFMEAEGNYSFRYWFEYYGYTECEVL